MERHDAFRLNPGPWYRPEHRAFQDSVRRFVEAEIRPFINDWDEAGTFPRDLYKKAAALGLFGIGFPIELGGIEADPFFSLILNQEIARAGSGGLAASLLSHGIGLPPVAHFASDAVRKKVAPEILAGEKIIALAITEPSGGSDVAAIRTKAVKDGDDYVVSGEKTFITSGIRADYLTTAVRTGGEGAGGVSLLLIEADRQGISRTPLKKMGWWCSDTAHINFDAVRVPTANLIGPENQGFLAIMHNFNAERLGMAALCNGFSKLCLEETIAYARDRIIGGRPLISRQAVRHKLVDMQMRIQATQSFLEHLSWRVAEGEKPIAEICLLKNQATLTMEYCAREAVQTFGGAGYMRPNPVERIYREVRVNAIGGGAEEVMRDLASRQMCL